MKCYFTFSNFLLSWNHQLRAFLMTN
eukprot:UN18003